MPLTAAGTADLDLRIDRLRGWFAILVMAGHAFDVSRFYALAQTSRVDMSLNIIAPIRGFLGFLWVIGFIVLSGYCIARSCERQGDRFSLWRYVLLRITRLYPLLIVAACLTFALETLMAGNPLRPQIWVTPGLPTYNFSNAVLGLSGFGQYGSLSPSYTITYELIYYAVWGVVWALFARWRSVAMIAGIAGLIVLQYVLVPGPAQLGAIVFLPWLIGAAVWLFRTEIEPFARYVPEALAWLVLLAGALCFAIFYNDWLGHPPLTSAGITAILQFAILGAAFALLIVSYTSKPPVSGPASWFDRWLGDISYPLFVVHGPIIVFVGFVLNWTGVEIHFWLHLLVLSASSIAAAHILVIAIERPVMTLRRELRSFVLIPRRAAQGARAAVPAE